MTLRCDTALSVHFTFCSTTSRPLDDFFRAKSACGQRAAANDRRPNRAHLWAEEAGQHLDDQIGIPHERSKEGVASSHVRHRACARLNERAGQTGVGVFTSTKAGWPENLGPVCPNTKLLARTAVSKVRATAHSGTKHQNHVNRTGTRNDHRLPH